jgi:hypothetical protein
VSCTPPVRTLTVALRELAFSKASTSPGANFIPFGPEELESLAPVLRSFRATLTAESCTADASHQAAWQTSEDGVAWGDGGGPNNLWNTIGSPLTGVGQGPKTQTSDWVTNLAALKRFVRFGVVASQVSVNTLQQGLVTLTLDLESRS